MVTHKFYTKKRNQKKNKHVNSNAGDIRAIYTSKNKTRTFRINGTFRLKS